MLDYAPGTKWSEYLLALMFGLAVVATYQSFFKGARYAYDSDSAHYIEQARNLRSGPGIYYSTPYGPHPIATDLERNGLFPPGYPLTIALAARLGVAEESSAPWINRLAAALVPAALVYGFATRLAAMPLLIVAGLVMLSPGMLTFQYMAMSDAVFLLLAVLSLGQLMRSPLSPRAVMASGALAGLAYCFRNAGTALLVAVPTALAASSLLRLGPRRAYLTQGSIWLVGAGLFVVPLVVYNMMTFGVVQPYDMPASSIGLLTNAGLLGLLNNAGLFVATLFADVAGFRLIAYVSAGDSRIMILSLIGMIGIGIAIAFAWRRLPQQGKAAVVLLACYVLAGIGVVILARTRFQCCEISMEGLRYGMQYSWAIILMLAMAANVLIVDANPERQSRTVAWAIALLLVLRAGDVLGARIRPSDSTKAAKTASENRALMAQVAAIPGEAMICSNIAFLFRIEMARPVRQVSINSLDAESLKLIESVSGDVTPHRPVYFVIVPVAVPVVQHGFPEDAIEQLRKVGAEGFVNRPDFALFKFSKMR